jgi:2-(1,2-epoxy-1,2-dihydrophenyl)acetyl-CoA isomerase
MNTSDKPLQRSLDGGVLTLILNRPEALNALTQPLMGQLAADLSAAAADPEVRVVILRGAGRAFCSGGDRTRSREPDPDDPIAARWSGEPVWGSQPWRYDRLRRAAVSASLLTAMPKPTLAMVRGPAYGAGLGLAAACDLRIASDTAVFRTAFAGAAGSGDFGTSHSLTRLLGGARAREMFLLDQPVTAEEALRIGLVSMVVPDADLEHATRNLATRFADGPTLAYRYIKENLNAAGLEDFDRLLDRETRNMVTTMETEDAMEARTAFRERRAPRFRGR